MIHGSDHLLLHARCSPASSSSIVSNLKCRWKCLPWEGRRLAPCVSKNLTPSHPQLVSVDCLLPSLDGIFLDPPCSVTWLSPSQWEASCQ